MEKVIPLQFGRTLNKIKFICGDEAVAKHFPVVPAGKMRPEWYSKLKPWIGEPHQSYPTI